MHYEYYMPVLYNGLIFMGTHLKWNINNPFQYGPNFITIEANETVKVLDIYDNMGWVAIEKLSGETGNVPPNFIEKDSVRPDLLQGF